MKKISIALLLLLTSCNALEKHKEELKGIVNDVVDEEVDYIVEELQTEKTKTKTVIVK